MEAEKCVRIHMENKEIMRNVNVLQPFFLMFELMFLLNVVDNLRRFHFGFGIQNSFIYTLKHSSHRCTRTLYTFSSINGVF